MKKILLSGAFALVLMLGSVGIVSAYNWTSSEAFVIPSWGIMSSPSKASITKSKNDGYGFIEAIKDNSSLSKYGDYCYNITEVRFSNTYYKIHVGSFTKIYYKDNTSRSHFRMRACGENYELSAGTTIFARFCE